MSDVRTYFNERSHEWEGLYEADPRFKRRFALILGVLERSLSSGKIRSALDMGCGTGLYSRWLAEHQVRVTAVDVSDSMLAIGRSLASDPNNPTFVRSDLSKFEPQATFDLVLALSMLEYVGEADDALSKLGSHVAPGGLLVVSVPNKRGLTRKLERLAYLIRRWTGNRVFKNRGEYLTTQRHQFAAEDLDQMLIVRGFRKERSIYMNPLLRVSDRVSSILERRFWAALYLGVYRKAEANTNQ